MNSYSVEKLGTMCNILSSKRIFAKEYVYSGIPFYRSKEIIQKHDGDNINTKLYISKERYQEIKRSFSVPVKGDMLMTSVGTIGVPYIVKKNEEFYFKDGNITWYKNFTQKLNSTYLFYLMDSVVGKTLIKGITIGSSQAALTIDSMKELEIPCPDRNIQDKIVSILSAYDKLIENNNRRIAILEEMAQRLYREWFVHFRFPGHENVKMVESKLGLIPENWHNFKIENIVSFNRGKSYRSSEINVEDGVPFINLKNIRAYGGFNKGGTKLFDGIYKESHKVRPGDIVMAVTDMTQERRLVGQVARVPNMKSDYAIISMDLIKLIPFQAQNSVYVYSLLRYSNLSRKIAGFANGANVLHLDPELVLQQDFIMPDDDTIKRFTSLVESLYNSVDICEEKNETLRKTRDHLLPRLISGDIDVSKLCVKIIKE